MYMQELVYIHKITSSEGQSNDTLIIMGLRNISYWSLNTLCKYKNQSSSEKGFIPRMEHREHKLRQKDHMVPESEMLKKSGRWS